MIEAATVQATLIFASFLIIALAVHHSRIPPARCIPAGRADGSRRHT